MPIEVDVKTQAEYDAWVASHGKPAPAAVAAAPAATPSAAATSVPAATPAAPAADKPASPQV
jgi:heme/copper-type cytochrome/quinol oxidase subunit 2